MVSFSKSESDNGRVDAAARNRVTRKLSLTNPLARLASNDLLCRARVGRADHASRCRARDQGRCFHHAIIFVARDGGHFSATRKGERTCQVFKAARYNGGVDAAAQIQSSIAGRIKLRNTLPPLASNDLLGIVRRLEVIYKWRRMRPSATASVAKDYRSRGS